MHCDRAQEFFSDYLEQTLDRPMTVAFESHLAGCVICREGVDALRSTYLALEAVPEVEPPVDGAWRVMTAIRQERAARYEAERRRAPTLWEWLRSLNPMSAAMGASLATMVIGGSLVMTGLPHQQWGIGAPKPQITAPAAHAAAAAAVQVSYGPAIAGGQELELRVIPPVDMPDGEIRVTGEVPPYVVTGSMPAGVPVPLKVQVPLQGNVQVLRVISRSRSAGPQYESTVVVPLGSRASEPMTLVMTDQPLIDALRRVAPGLGRPVVLDGAPHAAVTLQAAEMPAREVLAELAARSRFTLREENNVYRLSPAQ